MSFADSMDDLEAMNDPANTAQNVAARREARSVRPRRAQAFWAWLLSLGFRRGHQPPPGL